MYISPFSHFTQTSNSATFVLFALAKHPEIQDRICHEIGSVVGNKLHPSWDDLQKMKLIRNTIKETMRLYNPIGILPRIITEDAVLNGYEVPAGVSHSFYCNTDFLYKVDSFFMWSVSRTFQL